MDEIFDNEQFIDSQERLKEIVFSLDVNILYKQGEFSAKKMLMNAAKQAKKNKHLEEQEKQLAEQTLHLLSSLYSELHKKPYPSHIKTFFTTFVLPLLKIQNFREQEFNYWRNTTQSFLLISC